MACRGLKWIPIPRPTDTDASGASDFFVKSPTNKRKNSITMQQIQGGLGAKLLSTGTGGGVLGARRRNSSASFEPSQMFGQIGHFSDTNDGET